ncbi:AMP-binding protein [Aureibaculum sp. 2210JD6-5]|uniref:AMP-binding protein n=1 Tax=Aureibaculum sp. 2210JD6-5 TaxID=3103957 RepID=UPI002AAC6C43|nr:AMP-binding protein [Aureibaculum sp. 2210JD6-5]MDY7393645.1 AMP-binding protein [Aureibaculum sp. 2210JD6-5]
MNDNIFHKNFKLNGKSFNSVQELLTFSEKLSPSFYEFFTDWFDTTLTINVQTSGSTDKPKSIALKKEQMINSAVATGTFFDLSENTKALLCLSTDYIAGKMMLVRALTLGWHLDVVEVSSNPLQNIDKIYDFCAMVPMQVHHSLSDLHKIKKLIVGGGAVDNTLLMKLQKLPTEIFATYGMTETITHIAVKRLNKLSLRGDTTKQSVYRTLPNVKISTDSRGCLVIDAPKISDKKIITNDLVEIKSNTEFKWLGRADNVINSGGIKLIPERIEEKLSKIIDQRFFVAGIPDDILGEKLILIIESKKLSITSSEVEESISRLTELNKYEIPKEIYFIEKFVETETKKIQRQKTLDLIFKN